MANELARRSVNHYSWTSLENPWYGAQELSPTKAKCACFQTLGECGKASKRCVDPTRSWQVAVTQTLVSITHHITIPETLVAQFLCPSNSTCTSIQHRISIKTTNPGEDEIH
jgi:hypothetical protein